MAEWLTVCGAAGTRQSCKEIYSAFLHLDEGEGTMQPGGFSEVADSLWSRGQTAKGCSCSADLVWVAGSNQDLPERRVKHRAE